MGIFDFLGISYEGTLNVNRRASYLSKKASFHVFDGLDRLGIFYLVEMDP
jgi:hypothetical protein